ncbi:MAG: GNAT family N-acetyltransferase [Fusobacteriaceae bacterium]|nr:GNAT family N-acetyltransferase [Fusobacteriaceae bacterium]MBN2838617.1 GNAT family N-acetyltransferase [Fusobacteriaceae bacterium]
MEIIEIELMMMRSWPALEEKTYDGWIMRFSEGYTKRANSINPMYESYFDLEEKYEYCRKLYEEKKLSMIFKIMEGDNFEEVDRFLENKGLPKRELVIIKEIDIEEINYEVEKINISWGFDKKWFDFFSLENKLSFKEEKILKKILDKNIDNNIYFSKEIKGEIVACGMAVVEEARIGIFNIFVKENKRKKGYATEIIKGILVEARKINIRKGYLQVINNNEHAIKLYKKMGFREKYRTWYRY